jgi:cell division protein FtsW
MPKFLLLISVSLVFSIGLVMIFSTTSAEILDHDLNKSTHYSIVKQIYYACMGIGLGAFLWKIGYQRLLQMSPLLLGFFVFLLILTLIPGVGKEANGSRRWIGIAGFSFQPSEFVKYIVPAFFIHRFLSYEEKIFDFIEFLKLIGMVAVPVILVMVEPNNGTAVVIAMTVVILCLLTRIPFRYWAFPLVGFIIIGGVFAYNLHYVSARVKVYLNPELDLKGKGHQPYQAKIASGSGKLFGKGPGNSLQKLSYLPEAQNDYIAAIYAEEFGFIGVVTLIFLYVLIVCTGFYIANHTVDKAAFYLGGCIIFLIGFQAFLNLGVVSGLLPSTGLNLPFFSQGGSSLMANLSGIGALLSISKINKSSEKKVIPIYPYK